MGREKHGKLKYQEKMEFLDNQKLVVILPCIPKSCVGREGHGARDISFLVYRVSCLIVLVLISGLLNLETALRVVYCTYSNVTVTLV